MPVTVAIDHPTGSQLITPFPVTKEIGRLSEEMDQTVGARIPLFMRESDGSSTSTFSSPVYIKGIEYGKNLILVVLFILDCSSLIEIYVVDGGRYFMDVR